MTAEKARGRSPSKSCGLSTSTVNSPEGALTSEHSTHDSAYVNVSEPSDHQSDPLGGARGIMFALAICGGFYGSAILAAFLIDHPAYLFVALCLVALCLVAFVVMVSVRKEGAR